MNQPHLTKEVCKCVEASRLKRSSLLQTLLSLKRVRAFYFTELMKNQQVRGLQFYA